MKNPLFITCLSLLIFTGNAYSQAPANDNCENASEIVIGGHGYTLGKYLSVKTNVSEATKELAEQCVKDLEETGNCTKTVWYKFYIPTTRNLSVKLTQQDSAIPQIFAGFNIYQIPDCQYTLSDIAYQLPPLNKFGTSGNSCLSRGWYLIQVGCKKKAKGLLWVELNISSPASEASDSVRGYYHFGMVKNERRNYNFMMTCASLEPGEAETIGDSSFCKSIWFAVTFPKNSLHNAIYPSYLPQNIRCKYRLFNGPLNKDSIKSLKPFITITNGGKILDVECPGNTKDSTYYIQWVSEETDGLYLFVSNSTYQADAWNTPKTDNVVTLNYSTVSEKPHSFNCEAFLKTHACKNVIPPFFEKPQKRWINGMYQNVIDTFPIGAYTILNVLEDGGLEVNTSTYPQNNLILYNLYAGDIRNSCNLIHLADTMIYESSGQNFRYCISKGIYTLVTSLLTLEEPYKTQRIKLSQPTLPKYYHPLNPERLPDFNPVTGPSVSSERVNFRNKDTVIQIDQVNIKGSMTFSEIYISESSDMGIIAFNSYLYMFSGQISNGTAKAIPGMDYSIPRQHINDCSSFPKGYYSFVLLKYDNQGMPSDACFSIDHSIGLYPNFQCPVGTNTEPQFAFPILDNKDLLSATSNQRNLDYEFLLNFCKDCKNKSSIIPYLSCKNKAFTNNNTNYYYFTFYLENNASFSGFINQQPYELFEGDVNKNTRLIFDSTKIISPCKDGYIICNLQGKRTYTLVVPMNISSSTSNTMTISPHMRSLNDFASTAFNLGHITGEDSKQSAFTPVTCHTNGLNSEPRTYIYSGSGTDYVIPYKDTLNKRRVQGTKNLWYTFTVSGAVKVTFKSQVKYNRHSQEICEVYAYEGPYHRDFAQQLTDNFDSTIKSMKLVSVNFQFGKMGEFYNCGEHRYFMVLNSNLLNNNATNSTEEYAVNLQTEKPKVSQNGDHCINAVTGNYKSYGRDTLEANNACHTYGGSPGETDPADERKSTWFKISVKNLQKFDLEIQALSAYGMISYNVFGGTCGGMTKITSGGNAYSYFTLNCMGSGDYYIQVFSRKNIDADIKFIVRILNPTNKVCKPYDFKYPLALFKIKGGCNEVDTVSLVNASTVGSDMRYAWYMNGQLFSTAITPKFSRLDAMLKDNNIIRLIVLNSAEFTQDTFELPYLRDTVHYQFKINGPAISWCYDTLILRVKTNYTKKINYTWSGYLSQSVFSYQPIYRSNRTDEICFLVKGESENCSFSDTFTPHVIKTLNRYKDTFFCEGQQYVIKNNGSAYMSVNSEYLRPGDSIIYSASDDIQIMYDDKTCIYNDSIKILVEKGPRLLRITDNVYTCNTSSRVIQYIKEPLLKYYWSTGDTTKTITVNKSGTYRLNGAFSTCRSLDYAMNLIMENRSTDLLKDTVVCKYDDYPFPNPYGNNFNVLFKSPNTNLIKVTNPVQQVLKVKRSECIIEDSAMINMFPYEGKNIDSFYCNEHIHFMLTLDGGDAKQYNWYQNNDNQRLLLIHAYGNYPVARIDNNGCKDTINFNVITNCEFTVFVPTAFTPNNDLHNESFGPMISGLFNHYIMTVYDRWGGVVFQTDDSKMWDGLYKGEPAPEGVYAFHITVFDQYNKPYIFKGTVTVLH